MLLTAKEAEARKGKVEEAGWPFLGLNLEKERLDIACLMSFRFTRLSRGGSWRKYMKLSKTVKHKREAEERRFQAMQAQQQANNQTFMQLMGTVISALCPGQPHSSSPPPSVSTLLPRSTPGAWSMLQTSVLPQPV